MYTITPSKTGYTFSPASTQININGANVTVPDFIAIANYTYTLSGRILINSSMVLFRLGGLSGVTVNVNGNGVNINLTTDYTGEYSFPGLENGTYTVSPGKTDYTFIPASTQVTINGMNAKVPDFIANTSYTLSGRVLLDNSGLSGVSVYISYGDEVINKLTTDSNGNYSLSGLTSIGRYIVSPYWEHCYSSGGYKFSSSVDIGIPDWKVPSNRNIVLEDISAIYTVKGDVDQNGKIDNIDYTILEVETYYGNGAFPFTVNGITLWSWDLNCDEKIDSLDVKELRKIIYGW
jgi:hypothetical protein